MIASIAAASLAGSPIGDLATYRDWIVGCDNLAACHTTSLYPEPTEEEIASGVEPIADNLIGMAIERSHGVRSAPHVRFLPCYQCDPDAPDPAKISTLSVRNANDAEMLHIALKPEEVALANGSDGFAVPPDAPLIDALAQGESLVLQDPKGQVLASISLRGLGDAFRRMDDNQYRVGNVTALIARGDQPAYLVPPLAPQQEIIVPPASSRSPARVPRAALARLGRATGCDGAGLPETLYQRLDDNHSLLILTAACAPYHSESYIFVVDERGVAKPAEIRRPASDAPLPSPQLVSAYWIAQDRQLRSFARGRAMADCGQEQAFAWDGKRFLLVEEKDMGECRGSIDYITVYRRGTREQKAP